MPIMANLVSVIFLTSDAHAAIVTLTHTRELSVSRVPTIMILIS